MHPERKAKGSLSDIILDEVGLEGLEGLTIDALWTRLSEALCLPLPLNDWFQNEVWDFLKSSSSDYIDFYELPEPREKLKTFDRFKFLNPDSGFPIVPDECSETRYKLFPIQTNDIMGSCQFFHERKLIRFDEINCLQLQEIIEKYGEKFVMVGNQDFRESILYPENIHKPDEITKQQYCLLEIIARSRYNGEKTAGKYSLQTYCKDYADLFYIRNKLLSQNLIVKQPYTDTICGRSVSAYLITLPRFFIEHKTKPIAIIESIFNILENEPDHKMEYDKLKSNLVKDYTIYLKKLQMSHIFRKFFEIFKAPYRTIYPDAPRNVWKRKSSEEEKQLVLISLKNKNITLETIFNEENFGGGICSTNSSNAAGDSVEIDKLEFINSKHVYIDMPYMEQVYRLIHKHGSVGCSQSQLQRILALERLTVRALVKHIVKTGLVTQYWDDFGRQRTAMYVARHHAKFLENTNLENKNNIEETLKCEDIDIPSDAICKEENNSVKEICSEINKSDINEDMLTNINATVKDIYLLNEVTGTSINLKHPTQRQERRQKIIISTINEQKIIDKTSIRKKIIEIEKSDGLKDQICIKSMNRMLNRLAEKNIIKVYEITLEMRKCVRIYRYIVHPKLQPNHELLQKEIIKLKNQLHLNVEEREMRELVIAQKNYEKENSMSTKTESNSLYSIFYRRAPKFLTSRFFHEFLFYLVYEMNPEIRPSSSHDNIVKMLIESSPQYDLNNLITDLQTHYNDNLSWKMFIPPLQQSHDKPYGWAYIRDIIKRIPLSLLMKLYQIDRNCNELLNEYLNHPIKQHYLLQKLPSDLQDFIFKLRVGKTCLNFFKILNLIGLVQLGKRSQKDPKESWFYLNRNAKVIDTSISEPGYRSISLNKDYQENNYKFDTFQDVQNYWNYLYKTCCLTRLGMRIDVQQKNRQEPTELEPVEFEIAPEKDIGYIPGDGRGAGGLDSLLFSHLKSNWSWSVPLAKKKSLVKNSVLNGQRIKLGDINAKKNILKNIAEGTKRKITLVTKKKIPIKRRTKSNTDSGTAKSKRSTEYDEIDRDALTRMDSLRVQWNKDEDNLLKICRAVFIYLKNSVSQLNRVINAHNYRDILHWALNSRNKTSKACQRRILYIFKKHHNTDISAWVHELKRNRHIKQRFGNKFIDNLRKIYTEDVTFSEALKVHFVQLVYYLNKIIKNANLSIENECILPDTIMQFNRFYKECGNVSPSFKDDDIKHFDPEDIEDIEISTINSLMHSTMCCNRDKTLYNIQIFEIYKKFKEEILSKAFKKARDDCLVVGTKGWRSSVSSVTGPSFVLSLKYRQALYLNIPYDILGKCYETFDKFLIKFFSNQKSEGNHTIDFKTINSGVFYLLTEMASQNQIIIDIQMPQKILTIDPTQQQNVNDSERILDHFRQIFDNAPKQEYLKIFEAENNNNNNGKSKTRVKFNIANENYKLNYNPYNILSKLSDDYLHFFCALDHLNKIIDLDFTRFTTDNFCPFSNCILKNSNFIISIERIIHEKKSMIEDLLRTTETEEIIENIVILNQKNIMQIYYRLQDALRLRNRIINLKDYGKMQTSFQLNYLDILKLCKDIIEYKDTDDKNQQIEYEPILNKEEKIIRAHDIFVVNLPTLKVSLNYTEFINNETKEYKKKLIPKKLIQSDIDRETILKKILGFSIWSHFGSIDKLKEDETFKLYTTLIQSFIIDVLTFINTFPMGATAYDLVEKFKDEISLVNATRILRKHYLIMRVGIENFMYVHKNHIGNWVIQTYNIKRLDKEYLQRSKVTLITQQDETSENQKRKILQSENDDLEPATKQLKTNESEKRISKPVDRYVEKINSETKTYTPKEKETIIIRPCPWIRINGSINRRVLDRWFGCIVIDCLSNCGQTIRKLCSSFNQMHPVNLMCLLEILQDLNCINLNVFKPQNRITLFTEYENEKEEVATEFSKMEEVFITTTPNAIVNIALFIGDKKYITDFI